MLFYLMKMRFKLSILKRIFISFERLFTQKSNIQTQTKSHIVG